MLRVCQRRTNPPPHLLSLQVLGLHKGDDSGLHRPQFLQRGQRQRRNSSAEMLGKADGPIDGLFSRPLFSHQTGLVCVDFGYWAQILKVVFFLSSDPDDCLKSPPVCAVFAGFSHASCRVADSPSSLARLSPARFGLVWFGSRGYCKHP